MKRQSLLVITVVSLFVLAWWVGYSFLGNLDFSKKTAAVEPSVTAKTEQKDEARQRTRVRLRNVEGLESAQRESVQFSNMGWQIDESQKQPRACLKFSQPIDSADNLKIVDYIRLEPTVKLTAEITGQIVCIAGLEFSQDYTLTMLAGLQNAKGNTLGEDQSLEISFGDRPPHVAFVGDGVILPRIGAQGLAIETTNIDELDIQVFRVGERMLARRRPDAGQTIKEGRYYYGYDNVASEVREEIWSGTLATKGLPNTMTTTVFAFSDVIGDLKPGAYVIEAIRAATEEDEGKEEYDRQPARAWRWIVSTDLAFTTYQSPSGLDATVRSIDSGKALRSVRVELVAQNNEILGEAETDSSGRVHFDTQLVKGTGALSPRMLMAYSKNGDYALLDFNRSPLDLSAFAIGGRSAGSEVDAYVFADRGVYRPGETVNITAMLRDTKAHAVMGRSGQIRYMKPNYQEFRNVRFEAAQEGTVLQAFDVPNSAARGVWTAIIEIDGLGQMASTSFSVEDFVPQKLKVDIKIDEAPVRGDETRQFDIEAMFLYGANGSDLTAEAETRISVQHNPFPALKGYYFGLSDKPFEETFIDLGGGTTDENGLLGMDMSIKNQSIKTMSPLRAEITVGVSEPSGRYVKNSARVPVRTNDTYIGIKPKFKGRAEQDKPAGFNIKAVDWQGTPASMKAQWILVKEDYHYNWYRKNGSWQYRYDKRDIEVTRGDISVDASQGADVAQTLGWGQYRLIVKDTSSELSASYRFYVGWGGNALTNAPDQVQLGADSELVRSGDTVKLTINSPYAGTGELVIADQAVRHIQTVKVPKGVSEVSVQMPKNIGAGVYALLSVYTPRSVDERPVPRRAVGITYMKADTGRQTLGLTIGAPEIVKPRQAQKINVRFDNAPRGEKIYLTLAAVDEGILQITKYKSPDPVKFYFSRKAMPVTVRDDYVRLLNPNLGAPTMARSGGDSLGGEGLTAAPIKVVSLYSGLVDVKNNKASIEVKLPDFNGKLRLMAVAWSRTAVGSDVKPMIVRDAVPAILSLPRFLAPGDTAIANISLDNVGGEAGKYGVALTGVGDLKIESLSEKLELTKGQRDSTTRKITAATTGVNTLNLAVKGPGGYKIESSFDIQTRSPFRPVTRVQTTQMAAGETTQIDRDLLEGFDPGSVDIDVSFSRTPGIDPTAYASALTRYPYGCSEQTVSAAMPLLYADDIGGAPKLTSHEVKFAMQRSVDRLSNRQGTDGSFGLWKANDGYARPWLGVYITDFLYRAQEEGSVVSDDVLNKSSKALVSFTKMPKYPSMDYLWHYEVDTIERRLARQAETAAYAHYVLARNGNGKLSSLRYFSDNHAKKLRSALSWGHLGAALSMMGDERRADQAFKKALSLLDKTIDHDFYQSPTRDAAGVLALVKETGKDEYVERSLGAFQKRLENPKYLNTQAQAQVVMAIRALLKDSAPVKVSAKNIVLTNIGAVSKAHLYGTDLGKGPSFTNEAAKSIWRTTTVSGTPLETPLPVSDGYEVRKTVKTLKGNTVDLMNMKQGERYIVHVKIRHAKTRSGLTVLADLLPAGLEIETIIPYNDTAYPFLKDKLDRFQTAEMRDDRVVAATRTYYHKSRTYDIAYLVRAVTPGEFIWPGAVVEDMYREQEHAITEAKRIKITSGQEG